MSEEIKKIEERVIHNKSIYFSRVPEKEWAWFTNWCSEEFEGDYGMGLKWLVQGYMPPEETVLMDELEELHKVVDDLKMQVMLLQNQVSSNDVDKKVIRTLGGKEINKEKVI